MTFRSGNRAKIQAQLRYNVLISGTSYPVSIRWRRLLVEYNHSSPGSTKRSIYLAVQSPSTWFMLLSVVAAPISRTLLPSRQFLHKTFRSIGCTAIIVVPGQWHSSALTRSASTARKMKEKAKKPRLKVRDYCDVEPVKDDAGNTIWPAPAADMEAAREFIREWYESTPLSHT